MSDVVDGGDVEHFMPSQLTDTLSEPFCTYSRG